MPPTSLTPILPSRKVFFRERGERAWRTHTITILGKRSYFNPARSAMPMKLILESDIDGFDSIDIVAMNFFAALTSAFLSAESILLMLRKSGEVRVKKDSPFDIETDALFFSKRVQALRTSLVSGRAHKRQRASRKHRELPTAKKKP